MTQKFANAARAALGANISSSATTLTLDGAGDLFPVADTGAAAIGPTKDWFKAVIADESNIEIVFVRTHAAGGVTFSNVLRGQEGTTARAFAAGAVVGIRPTAGDAAAAIAPPIARVTVNLASIAAGAQGSVGLTAENFTGLAAVIYQVRVTAGATDEYSLSIKGAATTYYASLDMEGPLTDAIPFTLAHDAEPLTLTVENLGSAPITGLSVSFLVARA